MQVNWQVFFLKIWFEEVHFVFGFVIALSGMRPFQELTNSFAAHSLQEYTQTCNLGSLI